MTVAEDKPRSLPARFFSWFKSCRDSSEILLYGKYRCSSAEIETLRISLNEAGADKERINRRIAELEADLFSLPRGRKEFFRIYALLISVVFIFLHQYFDILGEFVKMNWENSPDYLMEFRSFPLAVWQFWQWLAERHFTFPLLALWLIGVNEIQSQLLWFKAYRFILASGIVSFAVLFLFMLSFSQLSFRPLI